MGLGQFYHISQMIALKVITLSGFHCICNLFLSISSLEIPRPVKKDSQCVHEYKRVFLWSHSQSKWIQKKEEITCRLSRLKMKLLKKFLILLLFPIIGVCPRADRRQGRRGRQGRVVEEFRLRLARPRGSLSNTWRGSSDWSLWFAEGKKISGYESIKSIYLFAGLNSYLIKLISGCESINN